ncbi:hypothetical protein ACHAW5_010822 [Stephanodiscus triporus]|uniref:Uncharacterized protein n=1 Tax=Stephanodiscus triporus TaxID=2934178 RepID=A0ABD3MT24_9STRA
MLASLLVLAAIIGHRAADGASFVIPPASFCAPPDRVVVAGGVVRAVLSSVAMDARRGGRLSSNSLSSSDRNHVEADSVDGDNDDDADDSFFLMASREAHLERMRLLRERSRRGGMDDDPTPPPVPAVVASSSPSPPNAFDDDGGKGARSDDADVVVSGRPRSAVDVPRLENYAHLTEGLTAEEAEEVRNARLDDADAFVESRDEKSTRGDGGLDSAGSIITAEGGTTTTTAAADDDGNDSWGSIAIPDGAIGGRRTITLTEALGYERLQRIEEAKVKTPIDPFEERRRRLRESISSETSDIFTVAEAEEGEKEEEEKEADKGDEEVEEETMSTIESDDASDVIAPSGTMMRDSSEMAKEVPIISSQESEGTRPTDLQHRPLSSDGKEIFEPLQSASSSSSSEVNPDNVDMGLFVLTRSLIALKYILDKNQDSIVS